MKKIQTYEVKVPGGQIYVKKWIPNLKISDTPILLLHDSLGSVDLWKDFPEILAKRLSREVIAYDRLGFGHSTSRDELPSNEFVWEEADIYFPLIKQQLSFNKYVLFGHSVGGSMAIGIAAQDADCEGLITESAQAFVEELTLQGIQDAKEAFQQEGQIDRLKKWHAEKATWVIKAWIDRWLSPEFRDWTVESYIKKVTCPVLAIHGENDEYGSTAFPRFISENSAGEGAMEIIENCGHVPHRQMQTTVLDIFENFLLNNVDA